MQSKATTIDDSLDELAVDRRQAIEPPREVFGKTLDRHLADYDAAFGPRARSSSRSKREAAKKTARSSGRRREPTERPVMMLA